jgi:hypothetical protein
MVIPMYGGCDIELATPVMDVTGNWSRGLLLKNPRRRLRGRTLPYVTGSGWVCCWCWCW